MILFVITSHAISQADTALVAPPDVAKQEKQKEDKKNKKGRKNEFILYTGVNFTRLSLPEEMYDCPIGTGYHLGAAYKQGRFFYWQIGARYNNATLVIKDLSIQSDSLAPLDYIFAMRTIDIPITGGINFLSFVNRLTALRVFVSVYPSFLLGVGDNEVGYTKDSFESFNFYGQGGVGLNVAFLVIEAGYNFGFKDALKQDIKSKPGQIFVNLGFRF